MIFLPLSLSHSLFLFLSFIAFRWFTEKKKKLYSLGFIFIIVLCKRFDLLPVSMCWWFFFFSYFTVLFRYRKFHCRDPTMSVFCSFLVRIYKSFDRLFMGNMKNVPKKIEIMVVFGILMSLAYPSFVFCHFNLGREDRFIVSERWDQLQFIAGKRSEKKMTTTTQNAHTTTEKLVDYDASQKSVR